MKWEWNDTARDLVSLGLQAVMCVGMVVYAYAYREDVRNPYNYAQGFNSCLDQLRASVGDRDVPGLINVSLPNLTEENLSLGRYAFLKSTRLTNISPCTCPNGT